MYVLQETKRAKIVRSSGILEMSPENQAKSLERIGKDWQS